MTAQNETRCSICMKGLLQIERRRKLIWLFNCNECLVWFRVKCYIDDLTYIVNILNIDWIVLHLPYMLLNIRSEPSKQYCIYIGSLNSNAPPFHFDILHSSHWRQAYVTLSKRHKLAQRYICTCIWPILLRHTSVHPNCTLRQIRAMKCINLTAAMLINVTRFRTEPERHFIGG